MSKQEYREQSRILWIVLSALSVIAIVIAAGLFFFFPSEEGGEAQPLLSSLNSEKAGRDFDPVEFVRNAEGYPELGEPEATDDAFSVDSSESHESSGTVSAETAGERSVEEPAEEKAEQSPEEAPNVIEMTPERTEPVKADKPEERTTEAVSRTQETRKISVTVYWIQVGSYTDLTKAEEVRSYLLTRDISSEIQTRSVDGKTYYRVRIGAFQSKGEADKFLVDIRKMKNFEESYVVQTTMIREVPVN